MPIIDYTASGMPAVGADEIRALAGNPQVRTLLLIIFLDSFSFPFRKESLGRHTNCSKTRRKARRPALPWTLWPRLIPLAFSSHYEDFFFFLRLPHYAYSRQATAIDTLLTNFIRPLQEQVDANSRVHCSLNLNTETGRLSARRPNLQNQPALEKDRYKAYVSELEQWPIYRC